MKQEKRVMYEERINYCVMKMYRFRYHKVRTERKIGRVFFSALGGLYITRVRK